ncbi:NAD(P)H-dependent oxidoreductase [Halobacillus shinanisalinarum]|uniref:NAD(P)H-dependent oxidoreductase n=1 Tax=Halobacillus shinanisalinarum TaxID=2932258 RepID=A0ABY4GV44_9BACI|nr:NAD(P)H-dependent oxidoreductase [Halobacillus shinanisalinarum]UOQ91580.1 NAD(P)H-dependent oxidoreductase [Halobacillus shinanisalinarum]
MSIAVIHGSTRANGNTEYLTHQAVPKENVTHIYLRDCIIEPIKDERHSEDGFKVINDDNNQITDIMLSHDVLIFSTPIYWYSMSGVMKNFIDRWSQTVREKNYAHFRDCMKGKKVYVIAVGGDSPHIKGLPLVQQFQYICDFFEMSFEGYVIGNAVKPGEIQKDELALSNASLLLKNLLSI